MYKYIVIFDGYHFIFEEPQKMKKFIDGVVQYFPKYITHIQIFKSVEMEFNDYEFKTKA